VTASCLQSKTARPATRSAGRKTASRIFLTKPQSSRPNLRPQSANTHQLPAAPAPQSVSGVRYYGHRFYNANLGRFINRDPSAEAGGINLYGFVLNNPVNLWDYLGNAAIKDKPLRGSRVLVGVQAGPSATAGILVAGVGAQGGVGGGVAWGGDSGVNQGTWTYGGSYAGNPLGGYNIPGSNQSDVTIGAAAGYAWGGVISNATSTSQLAGPFYQYNLDLPAVNFSFAKSPDGSTWTFSVTFGPSWGFAYSAYTTTTKTDGRNSPNSSKQSTAPSNTDPSAQSAPSASQPATPAVDGSTTTTGDVNGGVTSDLLT